MPFEFHCQKSLFYIYDRPLSDINVTAKLLCVEFADKILIFCCFKAAAFTTNKNEAI